jgi:hypothetical protein
MEGIFKMFKAKRTLAAAAALLLTSLMPASADYVIRDGNNALQTIKAFNCLGVICPQMTPADGNGVAFGTSTNPFYVDVIGITANMVRGSASATTTAATTIIAAPAAGLNIYVTSIQCFNTGPVGTTVTFNDSATTVIVVQGYDKVVLSLPTPLVSTATATAFTFTAGAATAGIRCNAQGSTGS